MDGGMNSGKTRIFTPIELVEECLKVDYRHRCLLATNCVLFHQSSRLEVIWLLVHRQLRWLKQGIQCGATDSVRLACSAMRQSDCLQDPIFNPAPHSGVVHPQLFC